MVILITQGFQILTIIRFSFVTLLNLLKEKLYPSGSSSSKVLRCTAA